MYPDERREVRVKPVDGVVEVPLHRAGSPASRAASTPSKGQLLLGDSATIQTGFVRPLK